MQKNSYAPNWRELRVFGAKPLRQPATIRDKLGHFLVGTGVGWNRYQGAASRQANSLVVDETGNGERMNDTAARGRSGRGVGGVREPPKCIAPPSSGKTHDGAVKIPVE